MFVTVWHYHNNHFRQTLFVPSYLIIFRQMENQGVQTREFLVQWVLSLIETRVGAKHSITRQVMGSALREHQGGKREAVQAGQASSGPGNAISDIQAGKADTKGS